MTKDELLKKLEEWGGDAHDNNSYAETELNKLPKNIAIHQSIVMSKRVKELIAMLRESLEIIERKNFVLIDIGDECLGSTEEWAQKAYLKSRSAIAITPSFLREEKCDHALKTNQGCMECDVDEDEDDWRWK